MPTPSRVLRPRRSGRKAGRRSRRPAPGPAPRARLPTLRWSLARCKACQSVVEGAPHEFVCECVRTCWLGELFDHPAPQSLLEGRYQHTLVEGCCTAEHVHFELGASDGSEFKRDVRRWGQAREPVVDDISTLSGLFSSTTGRVNRTPPSEISIASASTSARQSSQSRKGVPSVSWTSAVVSSLVAPVSTDRRTKSPVSSRSNHEAAHG